MIEGVLINLRPVTKGDLGMISAWSNNPEISGPFNYFGYRSPEAAERIFDQSNVFPPERGGFIVLLKDGTPVGDVSFRAVHYGPPATSQAFSIGINLIPEGRGKGYGVEAQRTLSRYLFNISRIERVEASTDIENKPEQRALEKAGFTREGVLRRSQFRAGEWHDLVLYSLLRNELN